MMCVYRERERCVYRELFQCYRERDVVVLLNFFFLDKDKKLDKAFFFFF
jgi:hypothetical protein